MIMAFLAGQLATWNDVVRLLRGVDGGKRATGPCGAAYIVQSEGSFPKAG